MGHRNPVRFLAPLALVAALVGVVVVVQASRPSSTGSAATTEVVETTSKGSGARRGARRKAYVVRAGDTLTMIAERTGVPLDQIERFNPGLDAQALRVGQRLRLTP